MTCGSCFIEQIKNCVDEAEETISMRRCFYSFISQISFNTNISSQSDREILHELILRSLITLSHYAAIY